LTRHVPRSRTIRLTMHLLQVVRVFYDQDLRPYFKLSVCFTTKIYDPTSSLSVFFTTEIYDLLQVVSVFFYDQDLRPTSSCPCVYDQDLRPYFKLSVCFTTKIYDLLQVVRRCRLSLLSSSSTFCSCLMSYTPDNHSFLAKAFCSQARQFGTPIS
jgi:hypothetical protein